jgi:hypothetical protein
MAVGALFLLANKSQEQISADYNVASADLVRIANLVDEEVCS